MLTDGSLKRSRDLPVRLRSQLFATQVCCLQLYQQQLRSCSQRRRVRGYSKRRFDSFPVEWAASRRLRVSGRPQTLFWLCFYLVLIRENSRLKWLLVVPWENFVISGSTAKTSAFGFFLVLAYLTNLS